MKIRRIFSVFLLSVLLAALFLTPQAYALEEPTLDARNALLMDETNGRMLYGKAEKEKAPKQPKAVVSQSLTGRPSKLGANKKKVRLRKGDAVEHTIYGQGVVLEIRGDVATIAFGHTIGVKKLNAAHPSIKKA